MYRKALTSIAMGKMKTLLLCSKDYHSFDGYDISLSTAYSDWHVEQQWNEISRVKTGIKGDYTSSCTGLVDVLGLCVSLKTKYVPKQHHKGCKL